MNSTHLLIQIGHTECTPVDTLQKYQGVLSCYSLPAPVWPSNTSENDDCTCRRCLDPMTEVLLQATPILTFCSTQLGHKTFQEGSLWIFPTRGLPRSTSCALQKAAVHFLKGRVGVKLALWLFHYTVSPPLVFLTAALHATAVLTCSCASGL